MADDAGTRTHHIGSCGYEANFEAGDRFTCTSLRRRGTELLSDPGAPLMSPWMGRLPGFDYRVGADKVTISPEDPRVGLDEQGRPLHGLLDPPAAWTVTTTHDRLVARSIDLSGPSFPFSHEIEVEATVSAEGLRITTTLHASEAPVPVAFGWHPFLMAPASGDLDEVLVSLPFTDQVDVDAMIPTGTTSSIVPMPEALHPRDDAWLVEPPAVCSVRGPRGVTEIEFSASYDWAVTWTPLGGRFVCIEPSAGPLSPFDDNPATHWARPSEPFSATFVIR
ncbi:MAG: hypothetical protein WCI12_09760 [Actinomycetes bacterium]